MRKLLHFRFTLKFPAGVASKSIALAGAGLAALSAQQIAIVVIMYIANSAGGVGAFTTFNYAYTVFMVPYGVLCVPIATAVFPKISASVAAQDSALTLQLVRRSTQLVILFGAAAAAMLVALAKPAKTVLEVGRDIAYLDSLMQAMAGGLIGFSLLYHVARIMYALGHGKRSSCKILSPGGRFASLSSSGMYLVLPDGKMHFLQLEWH
ncbi:lipid II flippase MurJ [Arcanobacterium hippocoleae]|uniref:lipid II flippase MurJ n=1 Tax=Arcanobacterium hippocoleae TaxID=149017 RepID=UPI003341B075